MTHALVDRKITVFTQNPHLRYVHLCACQNINIINILTTYSHATNLKRADGTPHLHDTTKHSFNTLYI